ncbi:hypothetical protein GIB67_023837 [Kingdonia uniflora]|uniref:Pentatricopeptide repeat-containing protein n=1 Tax=Kingdonia uniflora TaxID=39325 RepID=A0A7J7NG37_9MAGN|nr:hypothetical protein GIB67_023837 [Kingdonia uniflora]
MLQKALSIFQEMYLYNCKPDIICYNIIIDKLGEAGEEGRVQKLWSKMQSEGIQPDLMCYSLLLKLFCVTNKMDDALLLLRYMETSTSIQPNTYAYNTIIKAYLDCRQIKEALGTFGRIEIWGCDPDLCCLNLFAMYYSELGQGFKVYMFLERMIRRGVKASDTSFSICIRGSYEARKD